MAIRDARPDDLAEIVSLIRELAAYERLEHEVALEAGEVARHLFGPEPAARVLLATDDSRGDVVGFALWFRTFSTFLGRPGIWLEDLFVRPDHRGAGHGRALLEALRARTDGRTEWAVLDWNEPASGFYRSLGAAPVEGWTTYRWAPRGRPT
ncbi:MAG: GNAT family N-acetyltransferase [Acidimicrobiales bacterium]|nr:GNAT family N-acetyltransferase [Acidimicrobiales bacterium]